MVNAAQQKVIKLYEPNETINMIGVRLESKFCGIRLYTAHLKQQSSSSRDEIAAQFDEIKNQFRSASLGREPTLMIFDANVHVGKPAINKCEDKQDWGGKVLVKMIDEEGLTLINSCDLCDGVITRVDPRNGTPSTIDLAICNAFMIEKVVGMKIDEDGQWKLKKYAAKITETDHNTIVVRLRFEKSLLVQEPVCTKFNVRNSEARCKLQNNVTNDMKLDMLFHDPKENVDSEFNKFMWQWENIMNSSFEIVRPNKYHLKGDMDDDVMRDGQSSRLWPLKFKMAPTLN